MAEAPTKEFGADIKELGDRISQLTLKSAQDLVDYLKEAYGIEPAAGGMMAMAPGAGAGAAAAAPAVKDTFDVILSAAGDKKIQVIKVVRAITGLGLKEAKDLVDGAPKPLKQGLSKEEADKIKKEIEENGGSVELK